MENDFIIDPLGHKSFEVFRNKEDLLSKIGKLTDLDLIEAWESWSIYNETGKWPINETLMHDLYDEFLKDKKIPLWKGLDQIFYAISRESMYRWVKDKKDDSVPDYKGFVEHVNHLIESDYPVNIYTLLELSKRYKTK